MRYKFEDYTCNAIFLSSAPKRKFCNVDISYDLIIRFLAKVNQKNNAPLA